MTKLLPITDNISRIPKKLSIISIKYVGPIMANVVSMNWLGLFLKMHEYTKFLLDS